MARKTRYETIRDLWAWSNAALFSDAKSPIKIINRLPPGCRNRPKSVDCLKKMAGPSSGTPRGRGEQRNKTQLSLNTAGRRSSEQCRVLRLDPLAERFMLILYSPCRKMQDQGQPEGERGHIGADAGFRGPARATY